ncbi:MAG: hypothetical protein L3J22_10450 [Xanthomonadales bacterium]|nr:hypothetical protein [Xanthomonadales bacterium]
MNASSKLQVGLKDLDNITKSSLNYFFSSGLCPNARLCKTNKEAELLILDHSPNITKNFLESLESDNKYAIILHAPTEEFTDGTGENRLFGLAKPIQQNDLKKVIDKIFKLVKPVEKSLATVTTLRIKQGSTNQSLNVTPNSYGNSNSALSPNNSNNQASADLESRHRFKLRKYIGSNEDVDLNDPTNLKQIYITPEKYLYHYLSKAIKVAKLSKSDVVITTVAGRVLYELSSQSFYCFDWSKLKHAQANPVFNDTKLAQVAPNSDLVKTAALNATEIVWEAALLASKGRLPVGASLNNEIEIIYWPDLSKLTVFEHVDQIIATWALNPISISATTTQLKIPQRYVFALFCAMHAISSVSVESGESVVEDSPKPSKKSVFSKLFGKIVPPHN